MKKIRILYIITGLRMGGAEQLLLSILHHLNKKVFYPIVLSLYQDSALYGDFMKKGIPVHCPHYKNKFNPMVIFNIMGIIRRYKPDIVHTHLPHATIWGRIAAYFSGVKHIYTTEHNISVWRRKYIIFYLLYKLTSRFNTHIIAVSHAIKNVMIKEFSIPAGRISVIHNGIVCKRFTSKTDLPKEFENFDHPVIGTIGRLHRSKGHEYLIRAFKEIRLVYHNAQLLIVGEGEQKDELLELISQLDLERDVHLLGTRTDIVGILRLIDVYVFPSLEEGLGISLIEACAAKKPCVASNVGGIPEVIQDGENGLLVPPGDISALVGKILLLLKNRRLREKISEKALLSAQSKFRIEEKVRLLERLYLSHQ